MNTVSPINSDTLLDYQLSTTPSPLQASPVVGGVIYGTLTFAVSNTGAETVHLSEVLFTIPVGDLAQDLTTDPDAAIPDSSPAGQWKIKMTEPGVFTALPATGQPVAVDRAGIVFQFYNIPINQEVGTATIFVDETAASESEPEKTRSATFAAAKFPRGFFFYGFTAQVPAVTLHQKVTLTWQGSDNATYKMYWEDSGGMKQQDVTNLRSWISPELTSDTTFLLRASVVYQKETVTSDLSVTVVVIDPALVATSLNVSGDSALGGKLQVSGASTFASSLTADGPSGIEVRLGQKEGAPAYESLFVTIKGAVDYANAAYISNQGQGLALQCFSARIEYPTVMIENSVVDDEGHYIGTALELHGVLRGSPKHDAGGAVQIGGYGGVYRLQNDGDNIQILNLGTGRAKTFIIEHPQDEQKYLVHATLEGPEAAVFYRGSSRLRAGRAEIELPAYFEALTDPDSVTVQLTPTDGFDRLCVQTVAGRKVQEGCVKIVSDNASSTQAFDWEVKGMRRDLPPLVAEPDKRDISVHGFGPYLFHTPAAEPLTGYAASDAGAERAARPAAGSTSRHNSRRRSESRSTARTLQPVRPT